MLRVIVHVRVEAQPFTVLAIAIAPLVEKRYRENQHQSTMGEIHSICKPVEALQVALSNPAPITP